MKDRTRRVIALIAECIVLGDKPSFIIDHSIERVYEFSGVATKYLVDIFDSNENCFIFGMKDESKSLLCYHFGNAHFITLQIQGDFFEGYDFDSEYFFNGKVDQEKSVSLYDEETKRFYYYSSTFSPDEVFSGQV